jgi:hypothetical protein
MTTSAVGSWQFRIACNSYDFRLNKAAFESVVYAPTGFFLQYHAWRKNVTGVVKGPLPFFWGVSKAA